MATQMIELPPTQTNLQVVEVHNSQSRSDFLQVPWQMQAHDPNWRPPLLREVAAFIDPNKHPFFRHGKSVCFVAYRHKRPVGRLIASIDPRYQDSHKEAVGTFGMFESENHQPTADALLQAASEWLLARNCTSIRGPIDYSLNYPSGLLIDGFETPQRIMMNHNPPYYADLLQNHGLEKVKDLYAWWFDATHPDLPDWRERVARLAEKQGVVVRPINRRKFHQEMAQCLELYNKTWHDSWGFVPLTEAEFQHLATEFKRIAIPGHALVATIKEEIVGVCLTLPDINEALLKVNGRLFKWGLPIGLWNLLWGWRKIQTARLAVLGVMPGYRKRGIAEMLILRTLDYGQYDLGYTGAELSWTLEDNDAVNRVVERVGGKKYKTYRIYEQPLV